MSRAEVIEEVWKTIPEFPSYEISTLGRIYNRRQDLYMKTSLTPFGHVKITLMTEYNRRRFTRSVARLVAEAFCRPPTLLCDHIIVKDGDFTNVCANNLAWRPNHFAWKYTRQLKQPQPIYFRNLPVCNVIDNVEYDCIITAGTFEGLLFEDIWRATYTGNRVFPTGSRFEVADMEELV